MPHQSSVSSKKIDAKASLVPKKSPSRSFKNIGNGEERFRMISDATYYRALRRGFEGCDPVQDWLKAEADEDGTMHEW